MRLPKLSSPAALRRAGVLGMNQRNGGFIAQYNRREHYPRVDDKLTTKRLAEEFGIPVPQLYGVVERQHEVNRLAELLAPHDQLVIKPSQGSAGKGILVIMGRDGDSYLKPSKEALSLTDIRRHVNNTLSGLYSLGGRNDKAMVEALIQFSDAFEGFSYQGVPDVRVVVFRGYPVMAMMRLSTEASDGKANLHQGAVGAGIDLITGRASAAVQFDRPVEHHPDTGRALAELVVPQWDELILLATRCYEMTEIGYLGADIVLDRERGPLLLELNARPGLAIQIANQTGLQPRLERIEQLSRRDHMMMQAEDRVAFSRREFGGKP